MALGKAKSLPMRQRESRTVVDGCLAHHVLQQGECLPLEDW